MMHRRDLGGRGVLVTRPADQAASLCRLIEAANGRPVAFPTLEITPTADPGAAAALLAQDWDLMVFISRNAVAHAVTLAQATMPWSRTHRVAAVGRATAMALEESGRPPDLVPGERYDSESLLALSELADPRGWRVLIVRGEGGRATLADTLTARGAAVTYAEVYRRDRPDVDAATLIARWPAEIQLVTATSDEVLVNLHAMLGGAASRLLASTPVAVLSERTAITARDLGVRRVAVAQRADDQAMLEVLIDLSQDDP
jgi:uroporphyrinogen-III synthase